MNEDCIVLSDNTPPRPPTHGERGRETKDILSVKCKTKCNTGRSAVNITARFFFFFFLAYKAQSILPHFVHCAGRGVNGDESLLIAQIIATNTQQRPSRRPFTIKPGCCRRRQLTNWLWRWWYVEELTFSRFVRRASQAFI